MGYDISLKIDTGRNLHEITSIHESYNFHPIFQYIFEDKLGIKKLDGMLASEALPLLLVAQNRSLNQPKSVVIEFLIEECSLHPMARVCIE